MRHVPFGQLIWFVRPLTLFLTWFQCSIPFLRSKTKSQEILHFTRNSMNISPFFLSDWLPLFHNRTENFFYWKKTGFRVPYCGAWPLLGFLTQFFGFLFLVFWCNPLAMAMEARVEFGVFRPTSNAMKYDPNRLFSSSSSSSFYSNFSLPSFRPSKNEPRDRPRSRRFVLEHTSSWFQFVGNLIIFFYAGREPTPSAHPISFLKAGRFHFSTELHSFNPPTTTTSSAPIR